MRVVLDTNVLVSALLTAGGPPDAIVRAAYNGDFQLVASSPLVAELRSVLIRPRIKERLGWSDQEIAALYHALFRASRDRPTPDASRRGRVRPRRQQSARSRD